MHLSCSPWESHALRDQSLSLPGQKCMTTTQYLLLVQPHRAGSTSGRGHLASFFDDKGVEAKALCHRQGV